MRDKENTNGFSEANGNLKILLVDDEAAFVNIIAKRLSKRNFDVTCALSGTEAIQVLRKEDFDMCLLDLKMEDMNGIEVLKIFKKMVPGMPVVMLTGHGSIESAREGLDCGAFDYLSKPYDLEDLIKKIHEAVNRR